jgi:hypothetical protein
MIKSEQQRKMTEEKHSLKDLMENIKNQNLVSLSPRLKEEKENDKEKIFEETIARTSQIV